MGSITSRPKAPAQTAVRTKIIYVTSPSATDTTSAASSSSTSSASTDTAATDTASAPSEDEAQAAARVQGLLQRNRGIFGTVLTGFKGLLSPSDAVPHRKTLLGE